MNLEDFTKFMRSRKVLRLHNPFESRKAFGCQMRLVVNTYRGCPYRCLYCYTYSYTRPSDIANPKPKKDFENNLRKDLLRYTSKGWPRFPVYVSSNCEPFQPLEEKHRFTLFTLKELAKNGFPLIVMTKNPKQLLSSDYLETLDKNQTVIQITIPFLDTRFEPYAPEPNRRIKEMEKLAKHDLNVVVRIDPIIPTYGNIIGQTQKEIDSLIDQIFKAGIRLIGSKCLRLVAGIKKLYPKFYDELRPFYKANRLKESPWELNPELKKQLLTKVYTACNIYGLRMATCIDGRHVNLPGTLKCDGSDTILHGAR